MLELCLFYIALYHHHYLDKQTYMLSVAHKYIVFISDQVLGTEKCQSLAPHVFIVGHRKKLLLEICVVTTLLCRCAVFA